jgi:hypothetical protein
MDVSITEAEQKLRWFLLPSEAKHLIVKVKKHKGPVCEDRLSLKQYLSCPETSVLPDDPNPVGTLSGKAVFPDKYLGQRPLTTRPTATKRGYWLKKATMIVPQRHDFKNDDVVDDPVDDNDDQADQDDHSTLKDFQLDHDDTV